MVGSITAENLIPSCEVGLWINTGLRHEGRLYISEAWRLELPQKLDNCLAP